MADPSSDEKFDKGIEKQEIKPGRKSEQDQAISEMTGGSGGQPIGGNDSGTGSGTPLTSAYGGAGGTSSTSGATVGTPGGQSQPTGGQSATGPAQPGAGSAPPRSMGTKGSEFGQF